MMDSKDNKANLCVICSQGEGGEKGHLYTFSLFPYLKYHLSCLSNDEGKKWLEGKRKTDPAFNRYWKLSSDHLITCNNCSQKTAVFPKFRGHSPEWELNCDKCRNFFLLSPYQYSEIVNELLALMDECVGKKKSADELDFTINRLDDRLFELVNLKKCYCGGSFCIGSKPRCIHCNEIVYDSYFHFSDEPLDD